jgi:hypothetical protein
MLIPGFVIMVTAQDFKTLVADGTKYAPDQQVRQPAVEKVSAEEIADVKKEALRTQIEFDADPQASAEEMLYEQDFELLDAAKGFFISRKIEYKAFLYTAWSAKLARNYQGIMILVRFKNGFGKQSSKVLAHYVYRYQGDKFIRKLPDINRNGLSELAVFSEISTKKMVRRLVRIIEFSPGRLEKIGFAEIYSQINQKQLTPLSDNGRKPALMVYIPPAVKARKLFVSGKPRQKPFFSVQELKQNGDAWTKTGGLTAFMPQTDSIEYTIVK